MTIIDQGNGAAGPAAADLIKDTTTQAFVKDVIEESKRQPVLIDFWAEWCGPCKQLTPVLEKAVKAAKGKVKLVKMNIDQHRPPPRLLDDVLHEGLGGRVLDHIVRGLRRGLRILQHLSWSLGRARHPAAAGLMLSA